MAIVDVSPSMEERDSRGGRPRIDVAQEELAALQAEFPGRIAVFAFSDACRLVAGGVPSRFGVALMGLGIHRRSFLEGAIYAAHREQWGQRIDQYPLVRETLVDLLVALEAGMALTHECASATRSMFGAEDGARRRG